jgi:hypothetical protein
VMGQGRKTLGTEMDNVSFILSRIDTNVAGRIVGQGSSEFFNVEIDVQREETVFPELHS